MIHILLIIKDNFLLLLRLIRDFTFSVMDTSYEDSIIDLTQRDPDLDTSKELEKRRNCEAEDTFGGFPSPLNMDFCKCIIYSLYLHQ